MNRNRNSLFLFFMLLVLAMTASCTSLDIDGVRVGAGLEHTKATAKVDFGGGETKDSVRADVPLGRVELVNNLGAHDQVSLLGGLSTGSLGDIDFEAYDLGAAYRHYLGDGTLRPYGELAIGYRRMEVHDFFFGDGGLDMGFGSASVGLEALLGSHASLYAQVGYEGSFGDDFTTHGAQAVVGMAFSF